MATLIDLQDVSLDGTDRKILESLSLTVSTGDRVGVVGINGVGKTTLLRILAGRLAPDGGEVRRGRDVTVSFLEQNPELPRGTVQETLGEGWHVEATLDRLGMLDHLGTATNQLSGGQLKRVALARVFASAHDLIILDEPTNHLDLNAIRWLEQQIVAHRGAIVLVSHDRFLLDQVTTRMIEIDRGNVYLHPGGYGRLLEAQAEREERASVAEKTRRNLARTELAWLRRGVKARSTKPQARIDAAKRLLASRPLAAARADTLDLSVTMPRLGTTVVKAHRVAYSYDGERQILRGVDLELGPGDRVGIVGPNGSGKSTFVKLLSKELEPSSGTIKVGSTVVTSFLNQGGDDFDLEATVQELVAGPEGVPGSLADLALMKRFWFTGALPTSKAKELSGGERRRLQLLLTLSRRPNVLFLDEPTNDLDLETIRLVEEFLSQWPGTLVVVSHDRTFLSRTTDRLLEVHTDGTITDVPGGIDAWIARATGVSVAPTSRAVKVPSTSMSSDDEIPLGRLIRDAEKEMTRLERKRRSITERLVASSEHRTQIDLGDELAHVQRDLSAAENRWLELLE